MSSKPPNNVVQVDFKQVSKKKSVIPTEATDISLQKHKVFTDLIANGTVSLILDARLDSVKVPIDFKDSDSLRLNFSHRYGIKDFAYNEKGVSATLSFAKGFYFCVIPWKAVFLIEMADGKSGAVWSEEVLSVPPKDILVPLLRLVDNDEDNH
ncbi:MAG: hypothetical protein O2897_02975 [bacterium]|nr:hypothetical protein [bacterium]